MNKAELIEKVTQLLSNENNDYIREILDTLNKRDISRREIRAKKQREYYKEYYKISKELRYK